MSKQQMIGLLAETNIHVGAGQTYGAIDLPVAREVTTQFPVIPGSSLKGALRQKMEQEVKTGEKIATWFGNERAAGGIGVTDARLLLLPIRSLTSSFRWVTCPYILERFDRDLRMIGYEPSLPDIAVESEQAWIFTEDKRLVLEEYAFHPIQRQAEITEIVKWINPLIAHMSIRERMLESLTIISDREFTHFAQHALHIYARNSLDDETKESKNLWYEEALPSDSLLYSIFIARNPFQEDHLLELQETFKSSRYLQVGGNETIGQGWSILSIYEEGQHGSRKS
ncbi:CRISPR-associated protein, Cmr4 family [Seinonella peptonophila]|uniref:CRISPR-associated protein, Cmr4 family n=1 Tax=Seinonella peptonophila TaxID=112248 RepID=A0A1M5BN96_9BACL|nr:type III-B CRISPR module RAMP protein Cmr4 [Seinonella peptonophila]SHF43682.1 CRISPR-associated protein, Cmr4 family [Seinonella peptonophila]